MDVSIAVIGHIKRQDMADQLVSTLNAQCTDTQVKLYLDRTSKGIKWNVQRVIQDKQYLDDQWLVILQEDTAVCLDFQQSVQTAISFLPEKAIPQFYTNNECVGEAMQAGKSWATWLTWGAIVWGTCLCLPVNMWRDYIRWVNDPVVQDDIPYRHHTARFMDESFDMDWTLNRYLRSQGITVYYSAPCLVQHMGSEVSMYGHREGQSPYFIGENVSGLGVDWSLV